MKKLLLLIVLFSVGCATSQKEPYGHAQFVRYYVTEVKNAGGGIMITKCRMASLDCQQEFIEVTGGVTISPPAIQLNNNVK